MTFSLSSDQLASLHQTVKGVRELAKQGEPENWEPAYQVLVDIIQAALKGEVDKADRANVKAVLVWLRGAMMVNAGRGRFSSVIRNYTQRQLSLHGGDFSESEVVALMQQSSNRIGAAVIEEGLLGQDEGRLVTMDVIAERDAQQALDIVFASIDSEDSAVKHGAAWSGSVLFPMFKADGVTMADQSARLMGGIGANAVTTLESLRNVMFAVDAYSHSSDNAVAIAPEDKKVFFDLVKPDWRDGKIWHQIKNFVVNVRELLNKNASGEQRLQRLLHGTVASKPVDWLCRVGNYRVLDAIGVLFDCELTTTSPDDFVRNANTLFGGLTRKQLTLSVRFIDETTPEKLVAMAAESQAYLYALLSGVPLVFEDANVLYYRPELNIADYQQQDLLQKATALVELITPS